MTQQLHAWSGDFGKEYTDRNQVDWKTAVPFLRLIVGHLSLNRVLEVGCNRAHNLLALREVLGQGVELIGVEPGSYARNIARGTGVDARAASAFSLPFPDGYFDLVFTAGVLIHVSPEDLSRAIREVYHYSSRYVQAVEYFAEEETTISHHGYENVLWKRHFLRHYETLLPDLTLVRQRYLEEWDRRTCWLLEKPPLTR